MPGDDRTSVWIPVGGLGAIVLGIGLIPLRGVTSASNLAFVFIAFTIVVAEMGGRGPALLTAVVSAMSLNFFLTEPYLTLAIEKTDDLVAFVALAGCGLIAAAYGRRRARVSAAATRSRHDLEVLGRLVERLSAGASIEPLLEDVRLGFRLGRLLLRDGEGRALAAAPPDARATERAGTTLRAETLLPADAGAHRLGRRGFRLPEDGGCLPLPAAGGGETLDLWEGDRDGLDLDERQALSVAARVLGLELRRRAEGRRRVP